MNVNSHNMAHPKFFIIWWILVIFTLKQRLMSRLSLQKREKKRTKDDHNDNEDNDGNNNTNDDNYDNNDKADARQVAVLI